MPIVNRSGIEWVYINNRWCTHPKARIRSMKFRLLFFKFDGFDLTFKEILEFSFLLENKSSEWHFWSSFAYVISVIFPVAIHINTNAHTFISFAILFFTVTDCLVSAHALYSHYCLQCFAKIQCSTEIGIYVSCCAVLLFFFLDVWLKKKTCFHVFFFRDWSE